MGLTPRTSVQMISLRSVRTLWCDHSTCKLMQWYQPTYPHHVPKELRIGALKYLDESQRRVICGLSVIYQLKSHFQK